MSGSTPMVPFAPSPSFPLDLASIRFIVWLLEQWCNLRPDQLHLKHLFGLGRAYRLLDEGIATKGLTVLLQLLALLPVGDTCCVGATGDTADYFPWFGAAHTWSNGFCSIIGALSRSNCFFVRMAKMTASVKVKTRCIYPILNGYTQSSDKSRHLLSLCLHEIIANRQSIEIVYICLDCSTPFSALLVLLKHPLLKVR